jgi:hypothetical protein
VTARIALVLRNADDAFDATHDATDDAAHDGAHRGADRAGSALTDGHALLASADNALGLSSGGRRKSSNNDGYDVLHVHGDLPLSEICGFNDRQGSLVRPLWRHREVNAANSQQNRSRPRRFDGSSDGDVN